MKKVAYYFSLTGCCLLVADYLKKNGYEVREVTMKNHFPKVFFFRMVVGGFEALINKKRDIICENFDVKDYDVVTIVSPIWNDRLASPTNTLLSKLDLKDKTINIVLCSGSGNAKHAVEKLNKMYDIQNMLLLQQPNQYPDELRKLEALK